MDMKPHPELAEGPQAWKKFDGIVGSLLSVSHAELARRERTYRKQAAQNPNRRGPKRKAK